MPTQDQHHYSADAAYLPLGLPLQRGGMSLGAGLGAFLVMAARSGRAGVADLRPRSVRWRVPLIMSRTRSFCSDRCWSHHHDHRRVGEPDLDRDWGVASRGRSSCERSTGPGHDIVRFAHWSHQRLSPNASTRSVSSGGHGKVYWTGRRQRHPNDRPGGSRCGTVASRGDGT